MKPGSGSTFLRRIRTQAWHRPPPEGCPVLDTGLSGTCPSCPCHSSLDRWDIQLVSDPEEQGFLQENAGAMGHCWPLGYNEAAEHLLEGKQLPPNPRQEYPWPGPMSLLAGEDYLTHASPASLAETVSGFWLTAVSAASQC